MNSSGRRIYVRVNNFVFLVTHLRNIDWFDETWFDRPQRLYEELSCGYYSSLRSELDRFLVKWDSFFRIYLLIL